jgi:threonine synthase
LIFISTRGKSSPVGFEEAVFQGLAPDGGLYYPEKDPDLRELFSRFDSDVSFQEIAAAVIDALFEEFSTRQSRDIAEKAFPFSPVIRELTDKIAILELFHGPSCAFKDFGASFLATVMEAFLSNKKRQAVILTATSGDTGSAVARAFVGKENIDVVILYPSGRVSPLQEKQLTTVGGNVTALEVKGSFDDCQRMVKAAFTDPVLKQKLPLTSANSISLGRLLPQALYYIYGYYHHPSRFQDVVYSVPSGNFGNLTAGVYAWKWGLPVKSFLAATNINDVVPEYLGSGEYNPRASMQTLSNAMDVGSPSNFERLLKVFRDDFRKMAEQIIGVSITDEETLATIQRIKKEHDLFIDPHTAVGVLASERYLESSGLKDTGVMTLSTAHPGKFLEVVEEATGKRVELPARLEESLKLPKQATLIGNSPEDLFEILLNRFV